MLALLLHVQEGHIHVHYSITLMTYTTLVIAVWLIHTTLYALTLGAPQLLEYIYTHELMSTFWDFLFPKMKYF